MTLSPELSYGNSKFQSLVPLYERCLSPSTAASPRPLWSTSSTLHHFCPRLLSHPCLSGAIPTSLQLSTCCQASASHLIPHCAALPCHRSVSSRFSFPPALHHSVQDLLPWLEVVETFAMCAAPPLSRGASLPHYNHPKLPLQVTGEPISNCLPSLRSLHPSMPVSSPPCPSPALLPLHFLPCSRLHHLLHLQLRPRRIPSPS